MTSGQLMLGNGTRNSAEALPCSDATSNFALRSQKSITGLWRDLLLNSMLKYAEHCVSKK